MARIWLHLRPVEDLPPRATADIDLGIDRRGLRLTDRTTRVKPLMEALHYTPLPGDEGFRFEKRFGRGETLLVDLFVAKGASRGDPPTLERGVPTLAAPGLTYAIERGVQFVHVELVDGPTTIALELPLPALDAAFVLKGSLAASGVRTRPDRRRRDRVDAIMLAAACLREPEAVEALRQARNREALRARRWLAEISGPESAVPRAIEEHLADEHGVPGGGAWAVNVAEALTAAATRER